MPWLAIHDDVYPLVEKRDEVADGFGFAERLVIGPRDVGGAVGHRQIRRPALVGAVADRVARLEIDVDVSARKVEPVGSKVSNNSSGRDDSASSRPSHSKRTCRVLARMSMRLNGSCGWETIGSSSSCQSKALKSKVRYPARSGSSGRNAAAGHRRPPTMTSNISPVQLCAVKGFVGTRTGSSARSSTRPADSSCAATSASRHRVGRDHPPRLPHQQPVDRVGYRLAVQVDPQVLLGGLVAQRRQCAPEQVSHLGAIAPSWHPAVMARNAPTRRCTDAVRIRRPSPRTAPCVGGPWDCSASPETLPRCAIARS